MRGIGREGRERTQIRGCIGGHGKGIGKGKSEGVEGEHGGREWERMRACTDVDAEAGGRERNEGRVGQSEDTWGNKHRVDQSGGGAGRRGPSEGAFEGRGCQTPSSLGQGKGH
jgi:hypothetical protein